MRLIIAAAALWLATTPAHAAELSPEERAAALDLARYAANEAGLVDGWGDAVLIWQTAETFASTTRGRHAFLRQHSRCALHPQPVVYVAGTTRVANGEHNCAWASHLRANGQRPEGWPRNLSWSYHRPLWLGLVAWCERIVAGEVVWRPCAVPPMTWGGVPDHERAARLGMERLYCIDPTTDEPLANDGYRY